MAEKRISETEFYRRVWHQKPATVRKRLRALPASRRAQYRETYRRASRRIKEPRPSRRRVLEVYRPYWCLFKAWGIFMSTDPDTFAASSTSFARWEAAKYYLVGDPWNNPAAVRSIADSMRDHLAEDLGEDWYIDNIGMKVIQRADPGARGRPGYFLRTFDLDKPKMAGQAGRLRTAVTRADQYPPKFDTIAYSSRLEIAPTDHVTVDYDGPVTAPYDLIARRGDRAHTIALVKYPAGDYVEAIRIRWRLDDDKWRAILDRARMGGDFDFHHPDTAEIYHAYHTKGSPNPEGFPYGTGIVFDWKNGQYYGPFRGS